MPESSQSADRQPRYKGTSSFEDTELDRRLFFGREHEANALLHLILSEDLIVLFGRSGLGKTSLINARLKDDLRQRGFVPLVARINDRERGPVGSVLDGVRQVVGGAEVDYVDGDDSSLWNFFRSAELWSPRQDLLEPVLILDQFEELFTLIESQERRAFVEELAELVRGRTRSDTEADRSRPRMKIVIALREDFLAHLEELTAKIPAILANRFRLGPLTRDGARQAIVEPARLDDERFKSGRFSYQENTKDGPDAISAILDFLARQRRVEDMVPTAEVEPVQLQLLCQYVEDEIVERKRSQATAEVVVTLEDLGGAEEGQREKMLQSVLERFYERVLASLGEKRKVRAVQRLCEQELISASGRRLIEAEEEIERLLKIPGELLAILVNARLLRADRRLGGTFYELSHDSLVDPVLNVRRKRMARRRRLAMTGLAVLAALVLGLGIFVLIAGMESEWAEKTDAILDKYSTLLSTPQSDERLETVRAGLSETIWLYGLFPRKWPDDDTRLSGLLAWALDDIAARDPSSASEAQRLRDEVLASLRQRRPPPEPPGVQDPDWADIPGGAFMMSGPAGHRVTVSPFRMLKHEVTVAEYRRLVPDHPGEPDEPAAAVSWYEAYAYAAWLGGRLPTEAEWEYAARAGCLTEYCDRDGNETEVGKVAWTEENSGRELHPVGQLEPNPWGLVDMYGNAWEWVADWYDPYPSEPQTEPRGPPPSSSGGRVIRGSGFRYSALWPRFADRLGVGPRFLHALLGFRVAFPAAPEPAAQSKGPSDQRQRPDQ